MAKRPFPGDDARQTKRHHTAQQEDDEFLPDAPNPSLLGLLNLSFFDGQIFDPGQTSSLPALTEPNTINPGATEFELGDTTVTDVGLGIDSWARSMQVEVGESKGLSQNNNSQSERKQPASERLTCYGMLVACPARFLGKMWDLQKSLETLPSESLVEFEISFRPTDLNQQSRVAQYDHLDDTAMLTINGTSFARLRDDFSGPLSQVNTSDAVELIAYAQVGTCLDRIRSARKSVEANFKVDINVFGASESGESVGQLLSDHQLYLQHPYSRDELISYKNPHILDFDEVDFEESTARTVDSSSYHLEPNQVQQRIKDVIREEIDVTVSDDIEILVPDIRTSIRDYQAQAMRFMIRMEGGLSSSAPLLWHPDLENGGYRHKITDQWAVQGHEEVRGGIIADDMGMGKTLSALGHIRLSLDAGRDWVEGGGAVVPNQSNAATRSAGTLVVLPSLLVMREWLDQNTKHFSIPLKVHEYYGRRRKRKLNALFNSDIILTTYHTLASERKSKSSPVANITWFRIVLDEAHFIRRQSSDLYLAVSALAAQYRWCLTGTPIQNKLEDLGSLLSFIRFDPFDSSSVFRKYIINPFDRARERRLSDIEKAVSNLCELLTAVCIRRSKERLNLEPLIELNRSIRLSKSERRSYDFHLSLLLKKHTQTQNTSSSLNLFEIQLELRRFCNHGTFHNWRTFSQRDRESIDYQLYREEAMSSIGAEAEILCSRCNLYKRALSTNYARVPQPPTCRHVICDECIAIEIKDGLESIACSKCSAITTQISTEDGWATNPTSNGLGTLVLDPSCFNEQGYSSKMAALMKDVKEELTETKRYVA